MNLQQILEDHAAWLAGNGGKHADLRSAYLRGADLQGANLYSANLHDADLHDANLRLTDLRNADLHDANLRGADLCDADLQGANLRRADLQSTCLDPENVPSGAGNIFYHCDDGYIIGYRTEKAGHIDKYRVGRFYSADVFSTANTECHPGLYLWPTLSDAINFSGNVPMIQVRTKASEVHHAGLKFRCRWFEVVNKISPTIHSIKVYTT